jgi:hypothetical protein
VTKNYSKDFFSKSGAKFGWMNSATKITMMKNE